MSSKLFWAPPSFEWHTLQSTYLRNQLFWALSLAFYSFEQFLEASYEQGQKSEPFLEGSKECTSSQEPFFEWVYSRERSFEGFLKGSRSTRTFMVEIAEFDHYDYFGGFDNFEQINQMEGQYRVVSHQQEVVEGVHLYIYTILPCPMDYTRVTLIVS